MRMKPQISNLYLQGPLEEKKSIDELQSLFDLSLSLPPGKWQFFCKAERNR